MGQPPRDGRKLRVIRPLRHAAFPAGQRQSRSVARLGDRNARRARPATPPGDRRPLRRACRKIRHRESGSRNTEDDDAATGGVRQERAMADGENKDLRVPERTIPVPAHLSAEARAFLSSHGSPGAWPALDDVAGWKARLAAMDAMMTERFLPKTPAPCAATERHDGGVLSYDLMPEGLNPGDRRLFYDMHGGALVMGGG